MKRFKQGDWFLNEPLKILDSSDHPYPETAMATLGGHEVAVHLSGPKGRRRRKPNFRVFLNGEEIYTLGQPTPAHSWFLLCRELGYDPEVHWDWDPSLILFQQIIPPLVQHLKSVKPPYTSLGVPEGLVCLATLQKALRDRAILLHGGKGHGAQDLAAETFGRLPLRSVLFRQAPTSSMEPGSSSFPAGPHLGVFLILGQSKEQNSIVSRVAYLKGGRLEWSPWLPGDRWSQEERALAARQGSDDFWKAAGFSEPMPMGFPEAFQRCLQDLCDFLEPRLEIYRESYPISFAPGRDLRDRFLNRRIVDVRPGNPTIFVLDDGNELTAVDAVKTKPRIATGNKNS